MAVRMWVIGLCFVLAALTAGASPVAGQFGEELDAGDYDALLTLEPAAAVKPDAAVRVLLETGQGKAAVEVVVTRNTLTLSALTGGKRRVAGTFPAGVVPGTPYHLTLMRRGERIGLMHEDTLLGSTSVPRGSGALAGVRSASGWHVREARIQGIEPVIFSDDFMRDVSEHSPWTTRGGRWGQKSAWDASMFGTDRQNVLNASHDDATNRGQNPFALVGSGDAATPALCTTGKPFWEAYTCSVSVNPARTGAVGLICNLNADGTGLLVRWTPANDRGPGGNALTLCRYDTHTGARTQLAGDSGGCVPGQWFRLTVVSALDGVRVLVDGRERLRVPAVTPWRGAVGLYTEGDGATFDDVTVYGRALDIDLLDATKQQSLSQRFLLDAGMQDWVQEPSAWVADAANCRWYRQALYGDYIWLVATVQPKTNTTGELWLILNGDGTAPTSGYRAVVKQTGTPAKCTCTLYRNTAVLAQATLDPLRANEDYIFRLRRQGTTLRLELDGDPVLSAVDATPLTGLYPAYRTDGDAFANARGVEAGGHHTLDDSFTGAPVDWRTQGTWEPTIRWTCSPSWSFLAGWSRGEAVLWQKYRFAGDQGIEAFVGTKMDYRRETDTYFNRQGYFAVSLCTDGRDPRSGYVGIYGYPDEFGTPLNRAVILRNGVVVASVPVARRSWATNHRLWCHLRLGKRGNTVEFSARYDREEYHLSYTDAQPIDAGVPALWTFNNGMAVARARLDFANPPTPDVSTPVVIAEPDYPEWANQDAPLTLDLSRSWSASGRPVTFTATPAQAPKGEDAAVTVSAGGTLTFLPKKSGPHWYRIAARDGDAVSPDFHLSLPVFNPALGRDDRHALVLYRFDEGSGDTVRDHGIAPALDLALTADPATCRWLPGQGVEQHGGVKTLASRAPADKLLTIRDTKACTIECWASASTLFGPFSRANGFVFWEPDQPGVALPQPYLGFTSSQDYLQAIGGGPTLANIGPGFATSLHHVVLTWDGTITTTYLDGDKLADARLDWNPAAWTAGARLYVGGQQNGARTLVGQLYLLAIHDRCFTQAEVRRHYKAGPSAR